MSSTIDSLVDCKRVVSFGCSMVVGDELLPHEKSYAECIADRFNKKYKSYARNGNGNDSISSDLYEYLITDRSPTDFIIIGWSQLHRMRFYSSSTNSYFYFIPNFRKILSHTVSENYRNRPTVKTVDRLYTSYENILANTTDKELILDFEKKIFFALNALENNNIPFVMSSNLWEIGKNLNTLSNLEYYKDKMITDESFMSYMHSTNQRFLEFGHPDQIGHELWAEYVIEWIKSK